MPNLTSVAVEGLLGQFDHGFDFPEDWEFVILHGPNGIGKTKLLELINATLSGNPLKAATIPFDQATFSFDDGTVLQVLRARNIQPPLPDEDEAGPLQLEFELSQPNLPPERWILPISAADPEARRILRLLEREGRVVRTGPDSWIDRRTEEHFTGFELLGRYGITHASTASAALLGDSPVLDFMRSLDVHFIETQRLLTERKARPDRIGERAPTRSRVSELAEDLASKLSEALAQNSQTTQTLDRGFPRRIMLGKQDLEEATAEAIQEKYDAQNTLRQRLAEISLLDARPDLPLPKRDLENWERRVLWTYLSDSDQKLATFIPILERATLLKDIVNSRFLFKDLAVDRDRGFRFETEQGGDISADLLSSGEQHELVLTYELLFQAKRGSLVLIDEPEISLHVGWQKEFLSDIIRIAKVSSLRFIIATHSPQIINKWWSRAVALHPDPDITDEVPV